MSDYGTILQNQIEERLSDKADAELVKAFGATLSRDGDQWCCLLGDNLQEGHATFDKTPIGSIRKMVAIIYGGL